MKRTTFSLAAIFAIVEAQAAWTVTYLHPSGVDESRAVGAFGMQQVGYTNSNELDRAALWSGSAGSYVSLHPAGASESFALAASGNQQVGSVIVDFQFNAAVWAGTAASLVNLHPAGYTWSGAAGTSGTQQAGWTYNGGVYRAALWNGTAASFVNLHPAGATASRAAGTSGSQQVGYATIGGIERASLWNGTAASRVDLHPTGADKSSLVAINGTRQVGIATYAGINHAGLWTGSATSFIDLHPIGAGSSQATTISGNWQAGWVTVGGQYRASLWNGTAASWEDLSVQLTGSWSYSYADSIWTDGTSTYIAGWGFNVTSNRIEALLWRQVDPNSFTLVLNKASVAGQNSVLGTITMAETKATNTAFVTSDNSTLVSTPSPVTVLAGQLSRGFQITTTAITSTVMTTIFATRAGITRSQMLTLLPLIPTAAVCTPNPVTGGQPTNCRVVVNGVAGPGGRLISVFDSSPFTTMPSTITVPAGGTDVTFTISTTAVTAPKNVVVTARVSAGQKTGNFQIIP